MKGTPKENQRNIKENIMETRKENERETTGRPKDNYGTTKEHERRTTGKLKEHQRNIKGKPWNTNENVRENTGRPKENYGKT